ncbi:hypothetical protein Hanom_Chr14g01283231 [Helianthus anomalus]
MRRITVLEEDKIFKDAQIASLMEELVVKNQKINDLETNLGALSAVAKHGNRSGIHNWAYIDENGMFILKRKNGDVEYYENYVAFESRTAVDLRELSNSTIEEDEEVVDPATGKLYKVVRWPTTKQTNTFPLLKELLDNYLKDLQFWMFLDTRDLMCFGKNDINLLSRTQIQRDPQYEVCAKSWTGVVAQIMGFKLWSGQRTRVETQLYCLKCKGSKRSSPRSASKDEAAKTTQT